MDPARRIRAVTFDFWNTLAVESPDSWRHRVEAQRAALARHGVERTFDDLEQATIALRGWFHERWHDNQVVDPDSGAERLAAQLGLDEEGAGAELASAVHSTLAEVYRAGSDPAMVSTAPGIGDTLEALRSAGLRVGIICDAGMSPGSALRGYLAHHGLLRHFDHWSFSDEVGVFKPDPRIFAHAADGLGVAEPAAVAHVGDLRRTDVAGALAVGWTAVRYRGLNDDAPGPADVLDAPHVIDHHAELPGLLLGA